MQPPPQAGGATAALVLGILSLVLCPLCGPVAWGLGRKAEQEIDRSGGHLGGRGLATAGKILGIIGTVLIVVVIAVVIVSLAADSGGSSSTELSEADPPAGARTAVDHAVELGTEQEGDARERRATAAG